MVHTLLPRSTGLHYSLRSLLPRIPKLKVIDVTVAYPGTLSQPGFGQIADLFQEFLLSTTAKITTPCGLYSSTESRLQRYTCIFAALM